MADSDEVNETNQDYEISIKKHVMYFKRCSEILPSQCQPLDSSRMTILFFCISGLDLMNKLDILDDRKSEIIDWIYSQQILPNSNDPDSNFDVCGFRGSPFLGIPFENDKSPQHYPYDYSHIAMTYTALASLLILGNDLSLVSKEAVLKGLKALQQPNGSFSSTIEGSECDMRFVYCACCICYMLNDWSGIDLDMTVDYIKKSMNYDFGIAQGPSLESHGGSTFCAIASLTLMNRLEVVFSPRELDRLRKWCIMRQLSGFQGRPNKPVDTCYSFWIGASLELLGCSYFVDKKLNYGFVISTEGKYTGGFSKWPNAHPDPLHTYLGLCGLSLMGHSQLRSVNAALNISQRATDWLHTLHSKR